MEAIVLASTPPPAAKTGSQTDSAMGESDSPFAPLLTQAISEKESAVDKSSPPDSSAGVVGSQVITQPAHNLQVPPVNGEEEQIDIPLGADPSTFNTFSALALLLNIGQADGEVFPDNKGMPVAGAEQAKTNSLFSQATVTLTQENSTEGAVSPLTATLPDIPELLQGRMTTGQPLQTMPAGSTAQKQDLTLLLSQLQDIINTNETKGIVVQQQSRAAISLDELTNLTPQVAQTVTAPPESAGMSAIAAVSATNNQNIGLSDAAIQPAANRTHALRQDIQHQYLDGTINLNEDQTKKKSNGQTGQRDNSNSGQTSQPGSGVSTLPGDQTGSSTFSLLSPVTGTSQQVAQHDKTLTLPSGAMVTEQEIFNQIVQRFHLTNRMQNSRINLKLHPAELGELKIDITLKEGSIRANVYAQSQHVQELLEKNMPKLRAVLEQQGFVIEEIVVTSKSETVGNFDLFGGQLPNRQTLPPSPHETSPAATFAATLDSSMIQTIIPESGVNIRA